MATNITKKPLSPVDFEMETGAAGAVSNFTRATSTGSTESVAKFSAAAVPVIDAPIVATARRPFAEISPDSDTDIEACIQKLRINAREMKNFEHYGGVSGAGADLDAAKLNTKVWSTIMDEFTAGGNVNGVFFPGATYVFAEDSGLGGQYGNYCLPFSGTGGTAISDVVVAGTPDTVLAGHASASKPLFALLDVSDTFMLDLKLGHYADRVTIQGQPANSNMFNLHFDRIVVEAGPSTGLTIINDGGGAGVGQYVKDVWINDCTFTSKNGVTLFNTSGIRAKNILVNGSTGTFNVTGTKTIANSFGRIVLDGLNVLSGHIKVVGYSTSPQATVHYAVKVLNSDVSSGDIAVTDCIDTTIANNNMFSGRVQANYSANWASVRGVRIEKNQTTGGSGSQIYFQSACDNTRRCWIEDNDSYGADGVGIVVDAGSEGNIYGISIKGNSVLDYNTGGSSAAGILLSATAPNATIEEARVIGNYVRQTVSGNRTAYAIQETGTANTDNIYDQNMIKGWTTADIDVGSGGTDVANAAYNLGGAS